MSILFRKLKKANKFALIIYILMSLAYIVSLVFFMRSLLSLAGIETVLRIIALTIFYIWIPIYLLIALAAIIKKKWKVFIPITIISLILSVVFSFGAYFIDFIYGKLEGVNTAYVTYTTNLIDLSESEFNDESIIGMISDPDDLEGNILAKKLINKNNLNNEVVEYDDYYTMLHDLYEKEIDAIFVTNNYVMLFSSEEIYQNVATETKIVFEYSEKMENQDNFLSSNKNITEPFTVLLMGVDSHLDGLSASQAFNGDTLMLITFNPKTLTSTMFSLPRDLYVPIACRNNASAKINSSAASGTKCVIDTVSNLTDIPIDYYAKINFKGVVDLVDALGGIEVDVQKPDFNPYNGQMCEQDSLRQFGEHLICMDPGLQTLNGEQALAYSRNRKLYIRSDIDRNRHQQQVIEALINKGKSIRSFNEIESLLSVVSKNIETNMATNQILSFYNVGKDLLLNSSSALTIQKTYLEYYNLPVYLPGSGQVTSALGYYEASLNAIIKALKVNLELEEPELIKTASFSYNEEYESPIIGKGISDNSKKEVVPNFKGGYKATVDAWASARGISVSYETAEYGSINYNTRYGAGIVGNQSVPYGTFVTNVKSITIYINGSTGPVVEPPQNNTNNSEANDPLEDSGILP